MTRLIEKREDEQFIYVGAFMEDIKTAMGAEETSDGITSKHLFHCYSFHGLSAIEEMMIKLYDLESREANRMSHPENKPYIVNNVVEETCEECQDFIMVPLKTPGKLISITIQDSTNEEVSFSSLEEGLGGEEATEVRKTPSNIDEWYPKS